MKHFILNSEPDKDGIVRLDGNDYRYLVRVRRLAAGDCFCALLPNGQGTQAQVLSIDSNALTVKCSGVVSPGACCSIPPIILFQAMPKGDKMDLIARQAAEGGVTEVVPFVSEFSVAKTKTDGQKFTRWERIIKEARQQSGSRIATTLHKPLTIKELFEYWEELKTKGALGILFHHVPSCALEQISLHGYLNIDSKVVVLAVGPEGGFSDSEVSLFLEKGFKTLTIGDTILRTETAAVYCAAAIRIILLERDSWKLDKVKTKFAETKRL